MSKCPYCGFDNEDGTLFCEQCKSDLTAAQSADIPQALAMEANTEPMEAVGMAMQGMAAAMTPDAAVETGTHQVAGAEAVAEATVPSSSEPTQPVASTLAAPLPEGVQPKLVVLRGLRVNVEYPLFEGQNFIGRTDEKPVDIDLEDQEPPDRIWSSRQHAVVHFAAGILEIEDLNSSNGTFVNRTRVYPNQRRALAPGDVVQVGTVQLRVKV